jgi:hypothetical protein
MSKSLFDSEETDSELRLSLGIARNEGTVGAES